MPTKRTWRLWTSFLGSQQYMVSSLQPYTEIIREWVKIGVFRTYRWNILFQNTKGCQRWLGWTSSLALAASVDFAWGSVLCLLLSCSTGSPSNSAGISNFDPEKNFYLSSSICRLGGTNNLIYRIFSFQYKTILALAQTMCKTRFGCQEVILDGFYAKKLKNLNGKFH